MSEGLPKKNLGLPASNPGGLPAKNLGLPGSNANPEEPQKAAEPVSRRAMRMRKTQEAEEQSTQEETKEPKAKKSFLKKKETSSGETDAEAKVKPVKKKKEPKQKQEKDPNQKSLLQMSPAELKEHFTSKRHAVYTEPINIEEMVFIPKKPEVNLLPPEIIEGYKAKDLTRKYLKIGGAVVVAFLLLFGVSTISENLSNSKVVTLEDETADLNIEIRKLQPYEGYKNTIEDKRIALQGQMQKNLDVGGILDAMNKLASDANLTYSQITLDAASTECTSPDPFNTVSTIGCITFSAEGNGSDSVVKFFESAKGIEGFVNAYVPGDSAVQTEGKSTLEGSIGLTDKFYSQSNQDLMVPIDTILEDNAANAAPTTEETSDGNQ